MCLVVRSEEPVKLSDADGGTAPRLRHRLAGQETEVHSDVNTLKPLRRRCLHVLHCHYMLVVGWSSALCLPNRLRLYHASMKSI